MTATLFPGSRVCYGSTSESSEICQIYGVRSLMISRPHLCRSVNRGAYIKSCRWTTYLDLKTGETLGGITELTWLTWCNFLISGSYLELIVSRILLTTQSKFCKCYIFYSKIYEIGKYLYVMLVCTKNVVTQREMENYICRGIAGVDCTTSNSVGSNPTKINLLFRRAWTFGSVC